MIKSTRFILPTCVLIAATLLLGYVVWPPPAPEYHTPVTKTASGSGPPQAAIDCALNLRDAGLKTLEYKTGKHRVSFNGKPYTGMLIGRFPSGQPEVLGTYKDGLAHGPGWIWHKNGVLRCTEHFRSNELHGLQTGFDDTGRVVVTGTFDNGKQIQ